MSRKHDYYLNSGYVRKWKTFHCLENEQGLSYKKTPFMILIQENSLKFGIVVIVMLTIMLVIVFTIDFYSQNLCRDPKTPVFQFVPIFNTQC